MTYYMFEEIIKCVKAEVKQLRVMSYDELLHVFFLKKPVHKKPSTRQDNTLRIVFVITANFFIHVRSFKETFRTKMRPKIKKLNLLVVSLGKQSITSSRNKRRILITTLVMKHEKGVARVWSYCLQVTPFVSIIGFDLLKS